MTAIALSDYQRTTLIRVLERCTTTHPAAWCPCCGSHRTEAHRPACEFEAAMGWLRQEIPAPSADDSIGEWS